MVVRRLLILVVLGAVGCGPPAIETLCEDAARAQCAQCFSCGDLDGADLCRTAGSEDDCVETLASSCADQAATLESPKGAIQDCTDSLEELTCDTLVGAMTQDVSYTTAECGYFL
jgi:hypothetical protein